MTTTDDNHAGSIGRPTNGDALAGEYRWTCPICGASRTNRGEPETGRRNAIAAIRTHVLASDGDGHGPPNGYPDEVTASTFVDHVEEVGRR